MKFIKQHNLPYLVVFAISSALYVWYGFISDPTVYESTLAFSRPHATNGHWWQWITAHFVHSNFIHYLFNMIGLALLWLLHGDYTSVKNFSINFIVLSLSISLCILLFSSQLSWYVGMSGVLHGIFAWGVVIDIFKKRKTGYLLLAGLCIKLIDEQFYSSSTFMADLIEVGVAVDAHLYGAVVGVSLGLVNIAKIRLSATK